MGKARLSTTFNSAAVRLRFQSNQPVWATKLLKVDSPPASPAIIQAFSEPPGMDSAKPATTEAKVLPVRIPQGR